MGTYYPDSGVRRWRDRVELIVSAIVIATALYGWLKSSWLLSARVDVIEKAIAAEGPKREADHDDIIVIKAKIDYIVDGIRELKRKQSR
jgi:hypothetical protein